MKGKCPRCGIPYTTGNVYDPRRRSKDHILPQGRGGRFSAIHGDVRNIEIMCAGCNQFRGACGNCWGAVACIDEVARTTGETWAVIYKRWRFGHANHAVMVADRIVAAKFHSITPVRPEPEAESVSIRRARAAEAVRLGVTVHRIGVDEFIWPADTAAKRVWNLVTLARGGWDGPEPRQ